MSWNHRIMAHDENNEIYLQIHDVYYDENNIPHSYTSKPVTIGGHNIKQIKQTLNKMLECTTKPILWAGDKFPNEVKVIYTCELCDRSTFDKPTSYMYV